MSNKIVRGLTIDNGGSEVRSLPLGSSVPTGVTKLTNDFVSISEKGFRIKDTADKKELCRVKKAPKPEYVGIVACGLTGKQYDGQSLLLNSGNTKTGSVDYYRQFIFAVARDALEASLSEGKRFPIIKKGLFGSKKETGNFEEPIYQYALVTCIPIKEHSGNKDCATILKNSLKGEYIVEFPLVEGSPEVHFEIIPEYTGVVPEGGVAIMGLRSDLSAEDISLIIDMGHVTTDIALFKGTSLMGKVISSPFAGSTLEANVRQALAEEGFVVTEQEASKVLSTGKVKEGKGFKDVSNIVAEQKDMFVKNYLKGEIVQVLNMNTTNAKQVQNFVPIGAGMNETKGQGSIIKSIQTSCGLEKADVKILSGDLRYVNVEMASVFTKKLTAAARQGLESSAV